MEKNVERIIVLIMYILEIARIRGRVLGDKR